MARVVPVLGGRAVGKSLLILKLCEFLNRNNKQSIGFIPFESGISQKNSSDILTNSEVFNSKAISSEKSLNPSGLYHGYQHFPIHFCSITEGLKLNQAAFDKKISQLSQNYSPIFLEYSGGLHTPLFQEVDFLQLLHKLDTNFLYILDDSPDFFEAALSNLKLLKQKNCEGRIMLNNKNKSTDAAWFEYIWKTVYDITGYEVIHLLPYFYDSFESDLTSSENAALSVVAEKLQL